MSVRYGISSGSAGKIVKGIFLGPDLGVAKREDLELFNGELAASKWCRRVYIAVMKREPTLSFYLRALSSLLTSNMSGTAPAFFQLHFPVFHTSEGSLLASR